MNEAAKGTILEKIAASTRKRLDTRARKTHDFLAAFQKPGPHIIAEIKRKSPSEGNLDVTADPVDVAGQYLKNGATALSVLTEEDYFHGSLDFLKQIRAAHPDALLLMKDFIIDEYQLLEGRLYGADAALLILSLLDEEEFPRLLKFARSLGLAILVEVHDDAELKRAIAGGADLIGVNNRNLRTMQVSLDVARGLAPQIGNRTVICESGIQTGAEIKELMKLGYKGFLVGTSLMKGGQPGEALKKLKSGAA